MSVRTAAISVMCVMASLRGAGATEDGLQPPGGGLRPAAPAPAPFGAPTPGRALRIAGLTLTVLGATATTMVWVWYAASAHCGHDDCFVVAEPVARGLGPAAAVALGIGIPLLVLGVQRGKPRRALIVDSLGPTGLSIRF